MEDITMQTIGPYQILEEVGRGAMGVVYRGLDPAIGRPVAIKIIQAGEFASAMESAEIKLRFAREAAAAGKLSHPNIVTIYQLGEHGNIQYLVMELVNGEPLEKMLSNGQPWDAKTAVSILAQVADALDYAHSEGIVHRDVKPSNILLRADGRVKITDFGIARIATQTMTRTGVTFGTPAYMSPEQIMSARVSGHADQFSLGVIAYQMFSGRRPFASDTVPGLMHQIMSVDPPPSHTVNPAVSARTSELIGRALAKKPEDRFGSCKEFAERLAESLNSVGDRNQDATLPPMQVPASNVPAPERGRRGSRVGFWIAAGLAVVGLAGVAWVKWQRPYGPVEQSERSLSPGQKTDTASAPEPKSVAVSPQPPATKPIEPPSKSQPSLEGKDVRTPSVQGNAPEHKESPAIRAGATKVNLKDGLTYVWIPRGTFSMGCSTGDSECYANEKPAHRVTISHGFWMGQTEVTQEAYERLIGKNPSRFKGVKLPVENVTWDDAHNYCLAADMRLPTEAEWEYAARAGSSGIRYGDIDGIAWYAENGGNKTHEGGLKQANAWGLYDMLGNDWEWVADWFEDHYQAGVSVDPQGPATGTFRVRRGGSWYNDSRSARASERYANVPARHGDDLGVRCVGN